MDVVDKFVIPKAEITGIWITINYIGIPYLTFGTLYGDINVFLPVYRLTQVKEFVKGTLGEERLAQTSERNSVLYNCYKDSILELLEFLHIQSQL
jgi:hypothetical protein